MKLKDFSHVIWKTKWSQLLLLTLLSFSGWGQMHSTESRPNVVIIFIDDQGYYDLGCYGATEVKTPRIDQLAKEGIVLQTTMQPPQSAVLHVQGF